ncbi:SDR family NAD(P)-dependent oxidoreductase [Paenibacillus sp. 598K]|uniref:SDR family NAD(P)-dependent oxidoreductase n=1 Tax=Paenibacillus sp. 598K TaxID=1117987 RepID=UPI000FFF3F49|nr:SDR family oxidoreductase [Paenibacillus sp. 598K]
MIQGKKVLLTGATSGIGLVTAQMLIDHGALPIITGRSESKLTETYKTLRGEHGSYLMDVTSDAQVTEVIARIMTDYDGIDVLINNAGYARFETLANASIESYAEMMETNYMGTVRCSKALLPYMTERGSGQIVNIASLAGKLGTPKSTAYSATKHAVLGFTNALRLELAGSGVIVSAVNPGPVATPFFDTADPDGHYVNNVRWMMMKPERVARAILRVIERGKREVNLPFMGAAGTLLYQLLPGLADRIAGPWLNKK